MNVKYGCIVVAVFVPLALSFTTGCTSDGKPSDEKSAAAQLQVAGTVALVGQHVDFGPQSSGNECVGKGAFSGVKAGAQVRITDGTGQTLAVTRLGRGIADTSSADLAAGFCVFTFDASVPSGQGDYTIEVTHYGGQTFPENQMSTPHLAIG